MHPAYSVILFTTASGAGYGLLALLGLTGFSHGRVSGFWFGVTAMALALGLISVGLLSSTFHLGRPERAWRAFSQWRSSWLSREGVVSLVTFAPAVIFAALWTGILDAPHLTGAAGVLTAIMCAASVYCTGKIYSTLKTIRQWYQPLTVPVYFGFALATGSALLMAIASLFGRWQNFQAFLTVLLLIVAIVLKWLYWRAIDGEERSYTIEAATGLGTIGSVRQWEVPHTAENFVMKEMGYTVARKHVERLRMIILVSLALSAVAALLTLVPTLTIAFSIFCALLAGFAAVIERWLFFAEAQHVVSLYYGTARA